MRAPSDRRHQILPDSHKVDTQRTVSGRTRVHRIERRNDDNLCCWTSIEKWPRQYLGCHRRTRSQQSRGLPGVFPPRGVCVATLLENCGSPRWFREKTARNSRKAASKFINMTQICVYRATWKMMTTFEFWASGSSTLATSAAVKADSTLPARTNQARFDTNEHATIFFLKKLDP